MASARKRLGSARRNIIKRQKKANTVSGVLGAAATVASFGAGQAKKANTAWGEYESGYKEMGGDVANIKKPGFFKRTAQQILPGGKTGLPEGQVNINHKSYDRGQIRKAGAFLGSDASAMLSDDARKEYINRVAPATNLSSTFAVGGSDGAFSNMESRMKNKMGLDKSLNNLLANYNNKFQEQGVGVRRPESNKSADIGLKKDFINPASFKEFGGGLIDKVNKNIANNPTEYITPYEQETNQFLDQSYEEFDAGPRSYSNSPISAIMSRKKMESFYNDPIRDEDILKMQKDYPGSKPEDLEDWYNRSGMFDIDNPKPFLKSGNNGAQFGRYGDNAMKMIDGKPAHINKEIEGNMSEEDIKKYGSGTTNPITGKKEYFLGTIAAGMAIGSALYKGYQATQNQGDIAGAKTAAGDLQQEQLALLGDRRESAVSGANLGFAAAESQFDGGRRDVTMGTQMGVRGIQEGAATAVSRSGLATSGTIEQQTKTKTGDLMAKYKSDMTKLVETKQLAGKERDLSINKADLAFRQGEMSAEDAYQNTLTGLESQPGGSSNQVTNFLEGVFS